jgi:D-alanine-D-alanine ligase
LYEQLTSISRECWRLFSLAGYARVDFRVDRNGNPFVLEVNANPCISPDAGFIAACEMKGLNFDATIGMLIAAALGFRQTG